MIKIIIFFIFSQQFINSKLWVFFPLFVQFFLSYGTGNMASFQEEGKLFLSQKGNKAVLFQKSQIFLFRLTK